jgi:proline iminopeptidase
MSFRIFFFLSFSILFRLAQAQVTDSIKYDYGYLYYHSYGKGEPVIFLTGGPGNTYIQAEPVALELAKNSYRCILLEQRGTGRSIPTKLDRTTINLASAIDDLGLLLRHLKLDRAVFTGHSWGGALAMSFAAAHPDKVKGLILIAPAAYKEWQHMFDVLETNMYARLGIDERKRAEALNSVNRFARPEEAAEMRRMLRSTYIYNRQNFDSLAPKMDAGNNTHMRVLMNNDLSKNLDLTNTLPRYKGPIHIITGRQDILAFCSYEIKILVPSSSLNWVEGCGHFPFLEKPEIFYGFLFKALEEIK